MVFILSSLVALTVGALIAATVYIGEQLIGIFFTFIVMLILGGSFYLFVRFVDRVINVILYGDARGAKPDKPSSSVPR